MLNERIGPETARFAVLGLSLPHTWSPYIHNSLFDAAGLDAVYLPVPALQRQCDILRMLLIINRLCKPLVR